MDRIAEPWGARTPYNRGGRWPARVDQHLKDGVAEESVQAWVPTASVLNGNAPSSETVASPTPAVVLLPALVIPINRTL